MFQLVILTSANDDASMMVVTIFFSFLSTDETLLFVGTIMLNCLLSENDWVKNFGKICFSVRLLTVHTLCKRK